MSGVEQYKYASHEVFSHDVVLDVVCVVLNAESEQLQDEREQLGRLEVILGWLLLHRVGKEWCSQHMHAVLVEETQELRLFSLL